MTQVVVPEPDASASTSCAIFNVSLNINSANYLKLSLMFIIGLLIRAPHVILHTLLITSFLSNLHNCFVTLPNKTVIQVHYIGFVSLGNGIILHNVLYIPSFRVTLSR